VLAASLMKAGPGRENALLKRGAMLHADVEMLDPALPRGRGGVVGLERVMIRLDDGRQTGIESVANHWAFARRLLDRVTSRDQSNGRLRGPEGDPTVRLWYVATAAFMEARGSIETEHFDRALELFPMDREVLFFSAALHEVLAGPRRQSAFRNADILTRVRFQVGSEREELGVADRLYRRAVEADPDAAEVRIRYARVLGLRGRHAEAVAELTKVARQKEPLLGYYASLFLGGEYEALARDDEARDAYQRAASLFPRAQSPRVALSRLGGTMEQRQATREALLALTADADAERRYDPWWEYEQVQARGVTDLLAGLNAAIIAVIKEPR
jgi:tetratricopeptide (TPR) repeat protein